MDFVGDGAAEVVEGFADVGRVVVGFVGVLGTVRSVGLRVDRTVVGSSRLEATEWTYVTCKSF